MTDTPEVTGIDELIGRIASELFNYRNRATEEFEPRIYIEERTADAMLSALKRVKELEGALKPFAAMSDAMPPATVSGHLDRDGFYGYGGSDSYILITYGDLRAASSVLNKKEV